MKTEHVLEWIKTLSTKPQYYYCGTLNAKKEKSFGVYQLKESRARDIALGGLKNTKVATKGISILIHWNEDAAAALYADIEKAQGVTIGENKVNYIQLLHNEPIDVGADDKGICERVIEFIIYYERS